MDNKEKKIISLVFHSKNWYTGSKEQFATIHVCFWLTLRNKTNWKFRKLQIKQKWSLASAAFLGIRYYIREKQIHWTTVHNNIPETMVIFNQSSYGCCYVNVFLRSCVIFPALFSHRLNSSCKKHIKFALLNKKYLYFHGNNFLNAQQKII